ncbi:MAG TPA: hypothetical protein VK464_05160 [Symbiobacteriaceae bacterium]|jgi:hypothetical protein|nr:hypothetical protein [Symbiobacteriaceae bacterium]
MKKKAVPARVLSADLLQNLVQGLKPITKDTTPVLKGKEREPMISYYSPAYGRINKGAVALVVRSAKDRKLDTSAPGALRLLNNDDVPGYIVLEPVLQYDRTAKDQYELIWSKGNSVAHIDMLTVMQPRNMEVPKGYVNEIPLSLQTLPGNSSLLILHLADAEMREMDSNESAPNAPQSEIAAAEEP